MRQATDDELLRLHDEIRSRRLARTKFLRLDDAGKRAYKAEKQRQRRAALRAAGEAGKPKATVPAIRDVLADAAAVLLRSDGPGADVIRAALAEAFQAPAMGMTVTGMARTGRLPPRLLPVDWSPVPKAALPSAPDLVPDAPVADVLDDLDGFEPPAFLRRSGY